MGYLYINREAEKGLKEWKFRPKRKPLIIRGARQTGKSRLVEEFAKQNFEHFVTLNLEKEPQFKNLFENVSDVKKLLAEIEIIKNIPVISQKTLIFIDEIQECPSAITKLRYFYEDVPEQHVIAAGSLLEFVLETRAISFPVGRVEFIYLFPLNFEEFLSGAGEQRLLEYLDSIELGAGISPLIHESFRSHLKDYLLVGGMPEAAAEFFDSKKYKNCERIWETIIETYKDDFRKYSKRVNFDNLKFVFGEAPKIVGQQLNLTKLGHGEIGAREIKVAIEHLERAMVVFKINRLESVSFPMMPASNRRHKLLFLDLGLTQYMNRISAEIIQSDNYSSVYKGGLAEQLVGQELLPILGTSRRPELFYWHRDVPRGTSEVDYVFPFREHILPVEVKAGKGSSLASLHQFMMQNKAPLAIRIYDGQFGLENIEVSLPQNRSVKYRLLSVPFYLVSRLSHFCDLILKNV